MTLDDEPGWVVSTPRKGDLVAYGGLRGDDPHSLHLLAQQPPGVPITRCGLSLGWPRAEILPDVLRFLEPTRCRYCFPRTIETLMEDLEFCLRYGGEDQRGGRWWDRC